MSGAVTVSGWVGAAFALVWGRVVLARRMELVARACHDLRGPLTAIRLAARLAMKAAPPAMPGERGGVHGPLEAIELELTSARVGVDDLVAALGGRRAADRTSVFDVGVLLVDVAEAWRPIALEHDVKLRVDQPVGRVLVHGDRERLAQACGNLLANAIEHGRHGEGQGGGEVVLRARAGVHTVRIEVLDDGPGLPAPVAQLVRRRPRDGRDVRGRGLAIAADVAARHRGRLASAPSERGARLVLELPTVVLP